MIRVKRALGVASTPRSTPAAIVIAAALTLVGVAPAFGQIPTDPCNNFNWRHQLRLDQELVLSRVPLRVPDMASALGPGGALQDYQPSHGFADIYGNGLTLLLKDANQLGRPEFAIFYEGNPAATVQQSVNVNLPKNPYVFAGWSYFVPFDYNNPRQPIQTPQGFARCVPRQDWLIHEAGFHTVDGGFLPTPGAQAPPPGGPPNFLWHPRVWDLHVWVNLCGIPRIGMLNQHPNGRLFSGAGYAAPTGSFFYPPITDAEKTITLGLGDILEPVCTPNDI